MGQSDGAGDVSEPIDIDPDDARGPVLVLPVDPSVAVRIKCPAGKVTALSRDLAHRVKLAGADHWVIEVHRDEIRIVDGAIERQLRAQAAARCNSNPAPVEPKPHVEEYELP